MVSLTLWAIGFLPGRGLLSFRAGIRGIGVGLLLPMALLFEVPGSGESTFECGNCVLEKRGPHTVRDESVSFQCGQARAERFSSGVRASSTLAYTSKMPCTGTPQNVLGTRTQGLRQQVPAGLTQTLEPNDLNYKHQGTQTWQWRKEGLLTRADKRERTAAKQSRTARPGSKTMPTTKPRIEGREMRRHRWEE